MFKIAEQAKQETEQALTIIGEVEAISIKTSAGYEIGRNMMKKVKGRIKELEEIRKGQTRPLDEAKKKIMAFFHEPLQKLSGAKSRLNTAMVAWSEEQERIRRAEEKRLQDEARKRAEEEAQKAAEEAKDAGDKEEAERILKEPVKVEQVKLAPTIQTSKTSHIRETWSAEVVSLLYLVQAVANRSVPIGTVCANMPALNALARDEKQDMRIPGVRAVSKKTQI